MPNAAVIILNVPGFEIHASDSVISFGRRIRCTNRQIIERSGPGLRPVNRLSVNRNAAENERLNANAGEKIKLLAKY